MLRLRCCRTLPYGAAVFADRLCGKSACCFAAVAWDKGTPAILSPRLFLFGIYLQSLIVGVVFLIADSCRMLIADRRCRPCLLTLCVDVNK